MKILFVSVGKKHDRNIAAAIQDFMDRISHYCSVEWKILPSSENIHTETDNIKSVIDGRDFTVLLDERGKEISSSDLADFMAKRLNAATHRLVFIIGGAYGVDDSLKKNVQAVFSLSHMTFPHQIVRLILTEQVYRAWSIIKGEKYHH